jgi:heme O synthase-like polyprenyltransferase
MDAPPKGALMLVYFAAAALIGLSLLELGLYWVECHKNHAPVGMFYFSLLLVLFVLGVVAMVRARAIAQWIDNKLDQ